MCYLGPKPKLYCIITLNTLTTKTASSRWKHNIFWKWKQVYIFKFKWQQEYIICKFFKIFVISSKVDIFLIIIFLILIKRENYNIIIIIIIIIII